VVVSPQHFEGECCVPLTLRSAANHWINAELLTTTGCPVRLNLHPAFSSGGIVAGTAPRPILWTRDQSVLQWVLMRVIQLFCSFLFAINVEVIVAGLPEGIVASKPRPLAQNARRTGHPELVLNNPIRCL
jgi:hypothetical protein